MTVAIVIVSHSAQLARGVAELARQMTKGETPLAPAGGTGQVDSSGNEILGTSADIITAALQSVNSPDGTLVMLDLGSALLSAEMALEMLDEQLRASIRLTYAPLVEGTIAAALEASLGRTLDAVKQAAERTAQREQLRNLKPIEEAEAPPTAETQPPTSDETGQAQEVTLTLHNPTGLHARPASLFVQTAARFQSRIRASSRGKQGDATSILDVLALGARNGDSLHIRAEGPDAEAALAALSELVRAHFYENETTPQQEQLSPVQQPTVAPSQSIEQSKQSDMLHGITVSVGVALGPALLYTSAALDLRSLAQRSISITQEQVATEQARLEHALEETAQELDVLVAQLRGQVGKNEAAIFETHAMMARDPSFHEHAKALIEQEHLDAASALAHTGEEQASRLEALDDITLAGRAADIRDVSSRALRRLGVSSISRVDLAALTEPVILVARDLTPSDTAQLRPSTILGICTVQGGPTAHAAILARALGIPAISGLDEALLQRIHSGDELGLDADSGVLYIQPENKTRSELSRLVDEQRHRQEAQREAVQRQHTPLTIGKRRVLLLANVGNEAEAEAARQWGAEGIGLLRTEFLFAQLSKLPDAQEQRGLYTRVFKAFLGERQQVGPIVVRTLDVGADKPLPALQSEIGTMNEANPALGLRGIRIHLAHPHLLQQQLSALLLAAGDTGIELHIMLPMITDIEELQVARSIFDQVYAELRQSYATLPPHVPFGIMVEVPAAAIMAPAMAEVADFFSIGANDLLQYTLAADRTNTTVSSLYNPMQPAALRLIHDIAQAGQKAGKPVAVCGEIGGDPRLAPLLVGMGVDELSMAPTSLPRIRAALTGRRPQALQHLVTRVLQAKSAGEVEAALQQE